MNEFNFTSRLKGIAPDGGFFRDVDISAIAGTPAGSTFSSTAKTIGPFMIPRDYDEERDVLQLRLLGSTNVTSTLNIVTSAVTAAVVGASTTATQGTTSTNVTFSASSTYNGFILNLSGLGFKRDTIFKISTVIPASEGVVDLVGGCLVYASDLVAYSQNAELVGSTYQRIRG
jgi:hypothetical protein